MYMQHHIYLIGLWIVFFFSTLAGYAIEMDSTAIIQAKIDSIEQALNYQHGIIELEGGIGKVTIPAGFKYLNPKQAEYVITDLWGNPKAPSLGMIIPENMGVLGKDSWVFEIQYDEIGYVEDDDADDIDYDQLLEEQKKETQEANKSRIAEGYPPIEMIGWAATPYYDSERKILHWAKEIRFGDEQVHTLNYNVRILGRKGVLVLNAIASMNQLAEVNANIPKVLQIVQFSDGYTYADFDPGVDKIAAWTIGGLVAGKIIAKTGFLAGLLVFLAKFIKIILLAVTGGVTVLWKWLIGRKKQPEESLAAKVSAHTKSTTQTSSSMDSTSTTQTILTTTHEQDYTKLFPDSHLPVESSKAEVLSAFTAVTEVSIEDSIEEIDTNPVDATPSHTTDSSSFGSPDPTSSTDSTSSVDMTPSSSSSADF